MKASELMIGDWVQFSNGNKIRSRINCISPYQRHVGHTDNATWFDSFDDIEPIPLTEEILKANFKEGAMEDFYYTDGIEIYVNEAGVNVVAKFGIYGSHLDYYCLYVHELQHALRLCGFNDLADNFKVNN